MNASCGIVASYVGFDGEANAVTIQCCICDPSLFFSGPFNAPLAVLLDNFQLTRCPPPFIDPFQKAIHSPQLGRYMRTVVTRCEGKEIYRW